MTRVELAVKAGGTTVLAAGFLGLLGGMAIEWAVLVAALIAVVAVVAMVSPSGTDPVWTPLPKLRTGTSEPQSAALAGRMLEAARQPDRFRTRVQPRLRALALARLRRAGIDELADPRAAGVLGAQLYVLVTDPDAVLPDPQTTAELLAVLEEP